MSRTACVWIPQFELRGRLNADPELQGQPVLIADAGSLRATVIDTSAKAAAMGIQPQMPMSAARAICPGVVVIPPDPVFVARLSEQILTRLYELSPQVGRDGHEAFFLDLAGLQRIHRDEQLLATTLRQHIEDLELPARVAIADSPISAWVMARGMTEDTVTGVVVVPPGQDHSFMAHLPLSAIPMPEQLVRLCRVLGLSHVGDLQKLPAGALVRRFGRSGADVEQQARARSPDLFRVEIPQTIEQAEIHLDQPTADLEPLLFLHKSVLDRLIKQVASTRRAIAALELSLLLADSDRSRVMHVFRPARPTLQSRVWLDLITLWLSGKPVSEPIDAIVMRAVEIAVATPRQLRLFERQEDLADDAVRQALSRLIAAFGPQAVVRPVLDDCHRPEARLSWLPAAATHQPADAPSGGQADPEPPRPCALSQPAAILCLIDPPRSLEIRDDRLCAAGESHWHRIVTRHGPFTVEGEWWADGFRREYQVLTTEDAQQLWVYRDEQGYHLQAYLD